MRRDQLRQREQTATSQYRGILIVLYHPRGSIWGSVSIPRRNKWLLCRCNDIEDTLLIDQILPEMHLGRSVGDHRQGGHLESV